MNWPPVFLYYSLSYHFLTLFHSTKKTLSSLPLLTVNAGPRDANWKDRLKVIILHICLFENAVATAFSVEDFLLSYGYDWLNIQEEYTALIKYIQLGKENDTDWFKIESNKEVGAFFAYRLFGARHIYKSLAR